MTEPSDKALRAQFDADVAAVEAQWQAFWTPEIAASFQRCVDGEYDPPDAAWRTP